jgi:hypothetical protein
MTETKLFYIVISTLFIYGLSSFLQLGSFVLPLPFFEIGLLVISVFLARKVWFASRLLSFSLVLFGIFQFLAFDYNYTFFLSDEQMEKLSNSAASDVFKLLAHLSLVPILVLQNKSWNFIPTGFALGLLSVLLVTCLFLPSPMWLLIPVFVLVALQAKINAVFQNSGSFWLYISLFVSARELTLYLL